MDPIGLPLDCVRTQAAYALMYFIFIDTTLWCRRGCDLGWPRSLRDPCREWVLDYIVERKNVADLFASIKNSATPSRSTGCSAAACATWCTWSRAIQKPSWVVSSSLSWLSEHPVEMSVWLKGGKGFSLSALYGMHTGSKFCKPRLALFRCWWSKQFSIDGHCQQLDMVCIRPRSWRVWAAGLISGIPDGCVLRACQQMSQVANKCLL